MPTFEENRPGRLLWIGASLFLLALLLRLLFLTATPDAPGPASPYYEGDTPVWLEYARAIQAGQPHDLGLPLRPPGVAYLVAGLWNGEEGGLLVLRLAWCVLGALVVAALFTALQRSFGLVVAVVASVCAAASTGMLVLSTAPNNEIPYLLLVTAGIVLWEPLRHRPGVGVILAWAGLNGLACLVRAEHLLYFVLVSAYLLWAWGRGAGSWKRSLSCSALAWAFFLVPLVPWHVHAWAQIERFNRDPLPVEPATEQAYLQLERALAGLQWAPEASSERDALPGFARRAMINFVAATVATRGGTVVNGQDFTIIEEAFGSRPEALGQRPFVTMYGGLNFRLANNEFATGGFTRAPLEMPPPLHGGPGRYPAFLVAGLPPTDLTFTYPPHVEIVNEGYRQGWAWIREHPGDYVSLAVAKLRNFWAGAASGLTGYNLPLGMDGVRRPVDMSVPEGGAVVTTWRIAALAILVAGLWLGRRRAALVPWFTLLLTKTTTTLAFYGYAREGAVLIPLLALAFGLVAAHALYAWQRYRNGVAGSGARNLLWACGLAALALLAVESHRWLSEPVVSLDGTQFGAADPAPGARELERRLTVH